MSKAIQVIIPRLDFNPTPEIREAVAKMVACGLDELDIAFFLKIEPLEARRIFRDELRHGTSYFIGKVGAAMIDSALRGDVNAQRAFLQMRGRWAAPTRAEANDSTAQQDVEAKRKLMTSIIDMVTGKVSEGPPKQQARK